MSVRITDTAIVRHVKVKGAASPDDPAQIEYWQERARKRAFDELPYVGEVTNAKPSNKSDRRLEPLARKPARAVLREGGCGDVCPLTRLSEQTTLPPFVAIATSEPAQEFTYSAASCNIGT